MSGHSKWHNIQAKKSKTDAARAKVFTKIGKEMAIAIRDGVPNPNSNSKLRDLISKAKANNVPNDNIDRIIKKATEEKKDYKEITYEGYGPGGVAVIVETATDNTNRTVGNVRSYFSKYHGNIGTTGCVSCMFEEKGLSFDMIAEFSYVLVISKDNPLAAKERITYDDLQNYIEIAHADPYVPSFSMSKAFREEFPDNIRRRIFVFERASQFDLLSENENTFMWMSPVPKKTLDRYGLVERACEGSSKIYRDVLIYHKGYKLTKLDNIFIASLYDSKKKFTK